MVQIIYTKIPFNTILKQEQALSVIDLIEQIILAIIVQFILNIVCIRMSFQKMNLMK